MEQSQQQDEVRPRPTIEKVTGWLTEKFADGLKPYTSEIYNEQVLSQHYPWEEFEIIQRRVLEELEAKRLDERRQRVAANLLAGAQQLEDEDTSTVIPVAWLDMFEQKLRSICSDDQLDGFNTRLKMMSAGPITFRDLAFIGCVHRDSVNNNGDGNMNHKFTSPYKRIARASVSFRYRDLPFDNRQITFALNALEGFEFTEKVADSYHDPKNKRCSKAAQYMIKDDPFWNAIFEE